MLIRDLQQQFRHSLLASWQSKSDSTLFSSQGALSADVGMSIYRNAYQMRLREFLEHDFPKTFSLLKESEKKSYVREYAQKYSEAPTAAEFSQNFATYLSTKKCNSHFLVDLCDLEWRLEKSIYYPSVPMADFNALTSWSEEQWLKAKFYFDSATEIFTSEWPLDLVYENPKLQYTREPKGYSFCVYRDFSGVAHFYRLSKEEKDALEPLLLGEALGSVLDRGASFSWMEDWASSGLLRRIESAFEGSLK